MPPIRLTRTVDVDTAFTAGRAAIRGADVHVDRLQADSTVAETVTYAPHDSVPGLYVPSGSVTVRPQTTYRLRATTDDGTELTSTTTVPGPIEIVKAENDTTVYQSPRQPALTVAVNRAAEANRGAGGQSVFTFTTTSLLDFDRLPDSTLRRQLTPFYADSFSPGDDDLESFRLTSSGLLNEANFERNADGTLAVDVPWLAIAFYGPSRLAVNVVDDNYFDLLRSQNVQQGGFAPGEIPNVIEHVDGGTGIFGSYARAAQQIHVCRPGGACP